MAASADPAATTLVLVRHAAHDRVGDVLCGRMPAVRLGPHGRGQAVSLARQLASEPVSAVYSSPLERCRETAAPIAAARGCEVAVVEAMNEIDYGDWTGRRFDALRGDPRWQAWNDERATASPPGGEAMAAVQARALRCLEGWRIDHAGATIAAVTHGDVIKSIVCGVLGLSLDRLHAFDILPASVTALVLWAGGGKILALNRVDAAGSRPAERSARAAA